VREPYFYLIFPNKTTLVARKRPKNPTLLPYSTPEENKVIRLGVRGLSSLKLFCQEREGGNKVDLPVFKTKNCLKSQLPIRSLFLMKLGEEQSDDGVQGVLNVFCVITFDLNLQGLALCSSEGKSFQHTANVGRSTPFAQTNRRMKTVCFVRKQAADP